ncbi:MAG: hypothetical protein KAJ19_30065 [Gammaproteobacteria bacterium]|nr:hypothetical protein [Gammaproteobacteria bacterium]
MIENTCMDYIKKTYGVPAALDGRIKFQEKNGTIVGSRNAHLLIRLDGEEHVGIYHPTWEIAYLCDHEWVSNGGKGGPPEFRDNKQMNSRPLMHAMCIKCKDRTWLTKEQWGRLLEASV